MQKSIYSFFKSFGTAGQARLFLTKNKKSVAFSLLLYYIVNTEVSMKTAVVPARVDAVLKHDADAFFESIGMDTTTAIRIFLKQTLIQHKIPFEIIQDNSFYSEKNMKALEHSKSQMENGQHSIHELVEI